MSREELKSEYWEVFPGHRAPLVLVLDDGTLLFASRDGEGNGPGHIFGVSPEGTHFILDEGWVPEEE